MARARKLNINVKEDDEETLLQNNNNVILHNCSSIDESDILVNSSETNDKIILDKVELDVIDEENLLNSINRKINALSDYEDDIFLNRNSNQKNTNKIKVVDHNKIGNISELKNDINDVIKELQIDNVRNSFDKIIIKYDVNREFAVRINALKEFKTVFVLDDSTSMNCVLEDSPLNKLGNKVKRWTELQHFADISIEIANMFNQGSNTDVYFLNREPVFDIANSKQFIETLKQITPRGYTPLTKVFEKVIENNRETIRERKLLIIFVTDGEPTDDYGKTDTKSFYHALQTRNQDRIFITLVACTDNKKSISYLSLWDKKIKNLDLVDDYQTVKNEIIRSKGSKFQFSYGDYVVKAFIGSFDYELDEIDTKKNKLHYAFRKLNIFRNKSKK